MIGKCTMKLSEVAMGGKCRIVKVSAADKHLKRFMEMGLRSGAVVDVLRLAPLGDPIEIKIGGTFLSIRKENAENVDVESVE
jgi:Fe2+ transport system protein FeoA